MSENTPQEFASYQYHREKKKQEKQANDQVVLINIYMLERYLVEGKTRTKSEGIIGTLREASLSDPAVIRERLTIYYETKSGRIVMPSYEQRAIPGAYSIYKTEILNKNITYIDQFGKKQVAVGKPQYFIRMTRTDSDLESMYGWQMPSREQDEYDDPNRWLRETPKPMEPFVFPERIISYGQNNVVPRGKLTAADRLFLRSISEFNELHRTPKSVIEDFFSQVASSVVETDTIPKKESWTKKLSFKNLMRGIRAVLSKPKKK